MSQIPEEAQVSETEQKYTHRCRIPSVTLCVFAYVGTHK